MEAVPRLPMLSFELRASVDNVEFSSKLKQYIRSNYNEDPTLYASGITSIEAMRREAVYPSKDVVGCSLMKRYYCQLHFMASRFPMRENQEAAVLFTWKSLHSNSTIAMKDISLEMASILFNIGALHSHLGSSDTRITSEEMKMSCTHFQCAAWAFQHINEEFMTGKSLGLSPVLMSFMCHLCLAQAQECILEKSMMDNRKAGITAKIAVQVVDYYKQSLSLLSVWPQDETSVSDVSGLKTYKYWNKFILFKVAYYESILLLFQGQMSEDQQKMGERVTYFEAALSKILEARKLSTGLENIDIINKALEFVNDVIETKARNAKKENEFIYHESVPNLAHLPKIQGATLVKGISFNINDPEVCGSDLFSNIVPMEAHEAASLYSEEKAKLLRKINGMIESKNEELETFLSMLDLDEIKEKIDGNNLPQELIDRCASLNAKPDTIQSLADAMSKLSNLYHEVESMLNDIKELLQREEIHEKEYQQMLGKRPPSIAATDLTREFKKYQEAHAKASESNQTLHKAMVMHVSNMKLLSLPLKELAKHIPIISESLETETVTKEMRHLISKIEEMKQQRLRFSDEIRDIVCRDDITNQLVTYSGGKVEELFEKELKKYDKHVMLIDTNLSAQENILRALKETYAKYGSTRKSTSELAKKRAMMISSLIASYDAYEDLISKSSKGLDFYTKLENNVAKLLQRVKGTCKVQDEEREQRLNSMKKSDVGTNQIDPSVPTLKLKDYLNIKKETGKLSLEPSTVLPKNMYYNDPAMSTNATIPGVRPAPVGSEGTDSSLQSTSDSFKGFYQTQGKDQVWANNLYSEPQNADQKLKYYLPSAADSYSSFPQNSTFTTNEDAYPIYSYSTVLPKVSEGSYEPKSNYYDVRNSPNRYHHPPLSSPHPFNDPEQSTSASDSTYVNPDLRFSQNPVSNIFNQNFATPDVTPYSGYSTQNSNSYSVLQASVSQKPYESYTQPETCPPNYGSYQKFENLSQPVQSVFNPNVPTTFPQLPQLQQLQPSYDQSDSCPVMYSSDSGGYPSSQAPPFSSFQKSHTSAGYDFAFSNQPSISHVPDYQNHNYSTPSVPLNHSNNFNSQEISKPQSVSVSMNPLTSNNQSNQINPTVHSYSYSTATNAALTGQPTDTSGHCIQPSWSSTFSTPQNQQYLQSGNESLYTASQTPNYYAMTNSDVYKAPDSQNMNQENYGSHYYNSQYGTFGGQLDLNVSMGNPVTYMQAGTDKQQAVTTMTYSSSEAKSSPVTNPSNLDLLAGLDFNINQSPLVPEPSKVVKKGEVILSPDKAKSAPDISRKVSLTKEAIKEKVPPKGVTLTKEDLAHLSSEVEKYEKYVEGLTLKTLNGPTSLDLKWKEIADVQEKISSSHIISVARCYPMKNRFPDILPFDDSRVELPSTKDDYINASRMTDFTPLTPPFILTQAPLSSTYSDFWAMVFEQQVEVIVCLLSDSELSGQLYWPLEKGQELEFGKMKVTLQSSNIRSHWIERILSICISDTRMTRVVVHLQFTAWPGSSFPESPGPFLMFSSECINFFNQQRSYGHPVVVHCLSGVGRTGLFCLIIASILDIQAAKGIPDIAALVAQMCQFRKNCLRDREHLKFAYQAILYFCQDYLMKRGILTSHDNFDENKSKNGKCHTRHPSQDFLVSPSVDIATAQEGVERLEIDVCGKEEETNSTSTSLGCKQPNSSDGLNIPSDKIVSSEVLSVLESGKFSLNTDSSNKKKKRFNQESFNKGATMEASSSVNDDPLSQLDPLWTMKK